MRVRTLRVVDEGRVVRAEAVDPGAPLLLSRYQWRARYRRRVLLDLVSYSVVLVVLLSVVAAIVYVMLPDPRLSVLLVVLVTAAVVAPEVWAKGLYDHDNPPGLYREGLVHPRGFFVPYGELRRVEELYPPLPLMPVNVSLVPYFEQPGEDYTEWYFHARVLGYDGVAELKRQVSRMNEELGV